MWPNDTFDSTISSSFTKASGEDSWPSMTYFIQFWIASHLLPEGESNELISAYLQEVFNVLLSEMMAKRRISERGRKQNRTTLRKKTFIWRTRAVEEDRSQQTALQIQEFWSAHQVREHWTCVLFLPPLKRLKSQSPGSLVSLNLPDLWGPGKALGKGYPVSRERCLWGWRWHQRVLFQ